MPFIDVNGAHFYYESTGTGDAVVFLHAAIADTRMWDAQVAPFSQNHRVIRYDMRGFGQTTAPPMKFTHHDDLKALLDALGVERAAVIGCSNGGRAAMNFTLANPNRVTKLVMVCSGPGGLELPDFQPAALDMQSYEAAQAGDLEKAARLGAQLWFVGPDRPPEQADQAKLELVYEMYLNDLKKEATGIGDEQSMAPPAAQRLGEIHVPTLIVSGEFDEPYPLAAAPIMEQGIAGVRRVNLPTAHLPSMELPDEFNRVVLDFLDG
ncbi:MAG: alpha/beta fold hydrolase [Chloroflexi bacterium]|nr:alpha/beta fold hydrolase [Chloroflexota bacterium]